MKNIGNCKLCKNNVELRNSHIIPEQFYKNLYTEKHKFRPININSNENYEFEQKGYREYLLCQNCETKFSLWEKKLGQLVTQITTNNFNSLYSQKFPDINDGIILTNVDYASIKNGILSIFWRMSITTFDFFKNYNLGPYSEEIRVILDSGRTPTEQEFPIQITKILIGQGFQKGITMTLNKSRYSCFIMQSIVLNGVLFDCIMASKHKIPKEFISLGLQSSGKIIITNRSYRELIPDFNHFAKKIKASNIKNFYAQH